EVVHEAQRIRARDDRSGEDQGAVEAVTEVLAGEVVRLAGLGVLGKRARVRQGEAELQRRQGDDAEADDDGERRDDGMLRDHAHPAAGEALLRRLVRAGLPYAARRTVLREAQERR